MNRRVFLTATGAAAFFAVGAGAAYFNANNTASDTAPAASVVAFKPGVVKDLLAADKTVFVDVYTSWCSTCSSQGRMIEAIRHADPTYDASMVFVSLDWDVYSSSDFARRYGVQNRSTLLVLRGNKVLAGSIADTRYGGIKALMDKGLQKG